MTTTPAPGAPEDMNELYDAQIDRVDMVGAAANGHRFLIAKNAAGLVTPAAIRDLLKEIGAEDADTAAAGLVMNADPLNPPPTTDITKETPAMADQENTEPAEATEAVTKTEAPAETVAKADSMLAVFDRSGNLIGVIAPDALTPVDGGDAPDDGSDDSEVEAAAAVNPTEADGSSAIDGHDYGTDGDSRVIPGTNTVQSPVEKGDTPAGATVQAPPGNKVVNGPVSPAATKVGGNMPVTNDNTANGGADTNDSPTAKPPVKGQKKSKKGKKNVTKTADIATMLKEALTKLAEKDGANAELASTVEVLKGRLDAMGREPDDRNSPLIGGGTGAEGVAKRGADQEDAFAVFEKAVADAEASGNPAAVIVAKQKLQYAKVRALYPND